MKIDTIKSPNSLLVLIDGNSLINRAYYALPPLSAKDGSPSGAVYGFTTMLIKIIADYAPQFIAVAFDMRAPTFRHKRYDGYKSTRKGMPDDLAAQLPSLKKLLTAMDIRYVEQEGIEADDIIGTMAKNSDIDTLIVTGDRDSLQLIDDKTNVLLTKRGISETARVDRDALYRDYGLTPSQVIDFKALAGDSSDNIPGVGGVGEKTAVALLGDCKDLNGVYEALSDGKLKGALAERLAKDRETAYLSYELATIKTDCEINISYADCTYPYPFSAAVLDEFVRLGFRSLIKRPELFEEKVEATTAKQHADVTKINSVDEFAKLSSAPAFGLIIDEKRNLVSVAVGNVQYDLSVEQTLLDITPTFEDALSALKPYLEDGGKIKYVYDAKKLMRTLFRYGISLKGYRDVALMQYLADADIKYSDPFTYAAESGYETAAAACLTLSAQRLEKDLAVNGMTALYYDVELPLVEVLSDMETVGFKLDLNVLGELGKSYATQAATAARRIYELAGHEFNINSPKQLAKVLFEELALPYPKKGGTISTSAEVLSTLAGEEIVDEVLRYRFLSKLQSTFVEGLMRLADNRGIVHTEFNQMLTTTGRLSSSEPNLQNIPVREDESRELRGAFIAGEGNLLVAADYSQIELRVMAHLSGDKNLTASFESGEDIHSAVACELFDVKKADLTAKMRRIAKTVNFGIIYGMSAFGLASRLKISNYEAKEYIERYFARYNGVKEYLDSVLEQAKKSGCCTSILGRRRVIPELKSTDYRQRSFGERAAMNMPLQSSAADIIKLAMLRVHNALRGTRSHLILQVHDELIIETPKSDAADIAVMLKREMENAMKLSVPLVAEVKTGKSWLECK